MKEIWNWLTNNPFQITVRGSVPETKEDLARGGPIKKGTVALVGEKGPELFIPDSNGIIIPSHHLFVSGRAQQVFKPASIIAIENKAPVVNIGDTIINNQLDALLLEAKIRNIVVSMIK